MEKYKTIAGLLGMQQEEMAMLLQVHPSQWSMFSSGKRSLTKESELELAQILAFAEQLEKEGKDDVTIKQEESEIRKFCHEELIINQHKQNTIATNLENCRTKYESSLTAMKIINFLANQPEQKIKWHKELFQTIKERTEIAIQKNSVVVQLQYKLKLGALQQQELLLREWLSGT